MMGRKGGFLGGLISVFFLSILIFFILYFFMPDVSEKFFGFSKNQAYTGLKAAVSEINSFLNGTDDGKKVIEAIQGAAVKAGVSVAEFMESDNGKRIFDSAKDFIKSGAGKASDFFIEGEGHKMIEGLSE